ACVTGLVMGADAPRRVVVVAYPRVDPLDVAGPCEVFASARALLPEASRPHGAGYAVEVLSTSRELTIDSDSAVRLQAHRSIRDHRGRIDTLLVAGGQGSADAARDQRLLHWLRRTAPRVRRLGSVCTGAFVLGAA